MLRGPNIKPFPETHPLENEIQAEVLLKVGDNITTDHIMPAGAKVLPYRSNIPKISTFCFGVVDETFPERAKAAGKGIIVGGSNYGQGSSGSMRHWRRSTWHSGGNREELCSNSHGQPGECRDSAAGFETRRTRSDPARRRADPFGYLRG